MHLQDIASYYNHSLEGSSMKSKRFLITAIILISVTVALTPSIAKADILVYDNNDQYLGIQVYMHDDDMDLFISSLGGTFRFTYDDSGDCGDEIRAVFQSGDCSGTPYSANALPQIFDFKDCPIEGFYKVDFNGKQTFTPGSHYIDWGDGCEATGQYPSADYYPWVEVQMPFTTPVALPLKFKVRTKTVVVPLSE
jgi:hypothetical protein